MLICSPGDDPAGSDGVSGRFKAVLIACIVIMSILTIDVVVTEGLGKPAVGSVGAVIVGVILWFRERERVTRPSTSYVRGPAGLLEQRSGGATSFPLRDAHGDITAIASEAGEVASRQSYDPWGAQLSGPALEMGYLGLQQRRTDPLSGLVQMGARSYSPSLGRFMTEDLVFGHLGVGTSFNRHAYTWDNPLNLYDLDGRDVCVPSPCGDACAEEAAEDVGSATGDVADAAWNAGSGAAESTWNWTEPGRQWVSERARDFTKGISSTFKNFTTLEQIGTVLAEAGGAATCWYARSVITSAPTPPSLAVKAAAGATCLALATSSYPQLTEDIIDEE